MAAYEVKLDGKSLGEFDEEKVTNREAALIKGVCGRRFIPFLQGLGEFDEECMTALVWFLRRKNGEPDLRVEDVEFALLSLDVSPVERPTQGAETPDSTA